MDPIQQIELLRRYEPVLRFTRGEAFFPWDVGEYIKECSLWFVEPEREPVCLIPDGELDIENLARTHSQQKSGGQYYMQFVSPPDIRELAVYQLKKSIRKQNPEDLFHAGSGRLARVGYLSRLIDALFSVSLLARGRVPGDTAISAAEIYRRKIIQSALYRYYGRVIEEQEWIVLQYWYFYPFNNWRSGFFGLNDHEADWEQVSIYLYTEDAVIKPEWVAYGNHDFYGDDLRRRWDDPEISKIGEHPIVYVGAGSHASYFRPGEYLTEIPPKFLHAVWQQYLRIKVTISKYLQRDQTNFGGNKTHSTMFVIPFVEYARGDGKAIGYSQGIVWDDPVLIDENAGWVKDYFGLWGLYARDPVSGENAPAGPRYNQDGTVRFAWFDPIGWAGLDKILPPPKEIMAVRRRIQSLAGEIENIEQEIVRKQESLVNRRIEIEATSISPNFRHLYKHLEEPLQPQVNELQSLKMKLIEAKNLSTALSIYAVQLEAGEKKPPQAHIQRFITPEDPASLRINRIAEAWAALSIGLLLVSLIFILLFARQSLIIGLVAVLGGFIFIEAIFRGRVNQLIVGFSTLMASIAIVILVYEFLQYLVIGFVLILGGYIIWENLRELWI